MKTLSFFLIFTMTLWSANRAMVNLSDLDTEIEVTMDFYSLFEDFGENSYFISAGALIIDDKGTPSIYFGNIFFESEVQTLEEMTLALGIKPLHFSSGSRKFTTIPFGTQITYALPNSEDGLPLLIAGSAYIGGERFTSGDAKSYKEFRIGVAAETEVGMVFLQYRSIIPKYETGKVILNETIYAGIRVEY